jgi:hypothetical protein
LRNGTKAARFLFGGAGLLLVFQGCSDTKAPVAGSASSNTPSSAAATLPPIASTGATTTVAAVAPSIPAPPADPAALLQQALAAAGTGYHFDQTATVNGAVVLTIDGDRLTDGVRLANHQGSATEFEVITPNGRWVQPDGGEWVVDDTPRADVDPIAALSTPTSVAMVSNDGTTAVLTVTVPLASLGVSGDGTAPLQVTLVSGALTNVTYTTTQADGTTASVVALIGPPQDTSPVVPPI